MDLGPIDIAGIDAGLPAWKLAWVCAVVVFAGLVHGTLGLGFPLVSTPLIALAMDVRTAILLTLLPTAAVNVASLLRGGDWPGTLRTHWPLVAFATVGGVAGASALTVFDPEPFRLLLALLVVAYLAASSRGPLGLEWVSARPLAAMAAFGLAAGAAAGTTNVMVPILIVYALENAMPRDESVRVFNMCFLVGKLSQIATFSVAGLVGIALLAATTPLALLALGALVLGTRVRDRVPAETYRRVLRWLLWLLAGILVAQFFAG